MPDTKHIPISLVWARRSLVSLILIGGWLAFRGGAQISQPPAALPANLVTESGTPANQNIARFTSATNVTGNVDLTFNGFTLNVGTVNGGTLNLGGNGGSGVLQFGLLGQGTNKGQVNVSQLTAARSFSLPDQSGSIETASTILVGFWGPQLAETATAPTLTGFGTSPSVVANNGPSAFEINVGTGGAASTGSFNFPASQFGWAVRCDDVTTQSTSVSSTQQTGFTASSATVTQYSDVHIATPWASGDILICQARNF